MYCQNCGNQLPNDSAFCPKCGFKVPDGSSGQQQSGANLGNGIVNNSFSAQDKPSEKAHKKKSRKWLLLLILVIAVVIIIAVIEIASPHDNETVYSMTETHVPYEGMELTYGDLLDWMMTDRESTFETDGDTAYVQYSGKVSGGEDTDVVTFIFELSGLSGDAIHIVPYSMTLNRLEVPDIEDPYGMLYDLFQAVENKEEFPTFYDFIIWSNDNGDTRFDGYFGSRFMEELFEDGNDLADNQEDTPAAPLVNPPTGSEDSVEAALEQYREIVEQAPSQFESEDFSSGTGNYAYALVQMNPEDAVPTLLLEQEAESGVYNILVFQYDPDSGSMIHPDDYLAEGGSYRTGLSMEADGYGIQQSGMNTFDGHVTVQRVMLEDGMLIWEDQWEGEFEEELPEELQSSVTIEWIDSADLSALDV